jgi:hypothetical protein
MPGPSLAPIAESERRFISGHFCFYLKKSVQRRCMGSSDPKKKSKFLKFGGIIGLDPIFLGGFPASDTSFECV